MASLLEVDPNSELRLLDAGAGSGALFGTAVLELIQRNITPNAIHVTAYELDPTLVEALHDTMAICSQASEERNIPFGSVVFYGDFIEDSVNSTRLMNFLGEYDKYTHAILNPPYAKIHNASSTRKFIKLLRCL